MLLSLAQTLLTSPAPPYVTLSSVIFPSSPVSRRERLHGGSVRLKLSSADGENINQVMHIRQTSVREEGKNVFTRFLLIAHSMFSRLFLHPVFIYHSAAEDAPEWPVSLFLSISSSTFLLCATCFIFRFCNGVQNYSSTKLPAVNGVFTCVLRNKYTVCIFFYEIIQTTVSWQVYIFSELFFSLIGP